MHEPYETRLKHPADFRVKYHIYTSKEDGRKTPLFQGYRSDFWYEHPEHSGTNELFMIWPEFEDKKGNVIIDNKPVPANGTARMWIFVPERRIYHRGKIHIGLKGYFMEGPTRVAECEVIEILGLYSNPTKSDY